MGQALRRCSALLLAGLLAGPGAVAAQTIETGFLDRSIVVDGVEYLYQVYVPRGYGPSEAWPVILFLHGAGERGDDGLLQTQVGLGSAIRMNPERWPAIVVFPQVPEGMTWQGSPGRVAMAALDATVSPGSFRNPAQTRIRHSRLASRIFRFGSFTVTPMMSCPWRNRGGWPPPSRRPSPMCGMRSCRVSTTTRGTQRMRPRSWSPGCFDSGGHRQTV